ncbi:hypothetical protein [Arthrobacter alpinus]|uniref:hypothetical protein n=1 Tax=Arthrobacter alpinus TaxID=656366 RepID=UPI00164866DD|nr:hypothetical protein [Arthrobacter alpinus]
MWLWELLALAGLALLVLVIVWVTTGGIKQNNACRTTPAAPGAGGEEHPWRNLTEPKALRSAGVR